MDSKYTDALRYLSTPVGSFWKWDDQGAIVVWINGSTLAFREELAILLSRLSPKGLPPLDAVLVLIAATRAYWAEDSVELQHRLRVGDLQKSLEVPAIPFDSELFTRLDVVHKLSEDLNRQPQSKAEFAEMVFESAPRIVPSDVAEVVCEILFKRLNGALPSLTKLRGGHVQTTKSLKNALWPLNNGLFGVTRESFLLRQKTGLDAEPEPAEIDYSVDQSAIRSLLMELTDDEELAGLSRLARNLAAVVQLPRAVSDSDELPLGGVSDLSNRGTLDRLLLSELAHDDLMLATRVALNEALYLRREIPPSFPPERRHVLVDAGLRMWGVPRVFSTAVALSLAANGGKAAYLSAYRASGGEIVPVDLGTRAGLIEHLAALEPDAHPGRALAEFFHHVKENEIPGDAVLVTTDAVLDDPDFQRELRDADVPFLYIATVNRDGDFQLWSRGHRGRKCHATIRLDLDELLKAPRRAASKLIDSTIDPDGPAIFRVSRFPFRMPFQLDRDFKKEVVWSVPLSRDTESLTNESDREVTQPKVIASHVNLQSTRLEYAVIVLTRDRRLLMFDDSVRGALQLGDGLPFGKCVGSWSSDDGRSAFAVIHRESDPALFLFTIDLVQGTVHSDPLPSAFLSNSGPGSQLIGTTTHGGVVFVVYRSRIEAFDVSTKQLLDSKESDLPERWTRSRYFWNPTLGQSDAWYALVVDGTGIVFQRVPLGQFARRQVFHRMFDRRGRDGPFAISPPGILNLYEQTERTFVDGDGSSVNVLDVAEDGRRILIRLVPSPQPSMTKTKIIDTDTGLTTDVSIVESLCQFDATRANVGLQPMRRLTRAFIGDEQLTLVTNGRVLWQFIVRSNRLLLTQSDEGKTGRLTQDFESPKDGSTKYSMRVAKWADGSRLWVDSRGLLHLQSSDPIIPEATFVLTSGVAVWTSHGQMLGSTYYVDNAFPTISPEDVMHGILMPFVSRLR